MNSSQFIDQFTFAVLDSTLEDILAAARSQPESIEDGLVDDADSDSESSSEASDQHQQQPPPQTEAPLLAPTEERSLSPEVAPVGHEVDLNDSSSSSEDESAENDEFNFVKEVS
jgi:hypothetical protein